MTLTHIFLSEKNKNIIEKNSNSNIFSSNIQTTFSERIIITVGVNVQEIKTKIN